MMYDVRMNKGEKLMNVIVSPGSNAVTAEAADLFGAARVVTGGFREPIHINGLNESEAKDAFDWFESQGKKVVIEA
jgi:hypothetical protein